MTEKINKGCEFQSDCIEYKDISYLKVMPICAIYELSIACHHTVDRCKYYKLYKQLKRLEQENNSLQAQLNNITVQSNNAITALEQENKELKEEIQFHNKENSNLLAERNAAQIGYDEIREVRERYRSALEEIMEIAENAKEERYATKSEDYTEGMRTIGCYVLDRINEVLQ